MRILKAMALIATILAPQVAPAANPRLLRFEEPVKESGKGSRNGRNGTTALRIHEHRRQGGDAARRAYPMRLRAPRIQPQAGKAGRQRDRRSDFRPQRPVRGFFHRADGHRGQRQLPEIQHAGRQGLRNQPDSRSRNQVSLCTLRGAARRQQGDRHAAAEPQRPNAHGSSGC